MYSFHVPMNEFALNAMLEERYGTQESDEPLTTIDALDAMIRDAWRNSEWDLASRLQVLGSNVQQCARVSI